MFKKKNERSQRRGLEVPRAAHHLEMNHAGCLQAAPSPSLALLLGPGDVEAGGGTVRTRQPMTAPPTPLGSSRAGRGHLARG